jgi:hypothetical protein
LSGNHPNAEIERIFSKKINLVDIFLLLTANSSLPQVDSVLQRFKVLSLHDDRLFNHLTTCTEHKLHLIRSTAIEIFGNEASLPLAEMPDFLRTKCQGVKAEHQETAKCVGEDNSVIEAMDAVSKATAEDLHLTFRNLKFSPQSDIFEKLLAECQKMEKLDLQVWSLRWKLQFYTTEKIAQLRKEVTFLADSKTRLQSEIAAADRKKKVYESLGPEFKQLARIYGSILRDIEIEKRIMAISASP